MVNKKSYLIFYRCNIDVKCLGYEYRAMVESTCRIIQQSCTDPEMFDSAQNTVIYRKGRVFVQ